MVIIKIIVGSTRPSRFGIQPANWIAALAQDYPDAVFELVDLADINLPLLDEPEPAINNSYANEHTKAWSKIIDDADGFIVVTPEYNHGVPAALKNAFDFLAREWRHKPIAFVSYGTYAGGTRAVEHLRSALAVLSMYDLKEQVAISNYWRQLDENGTFKPTEAQTAEANRLIDRIVFWSRHLKTARAELAERTTAE